MKAKQRITLSFLLNYQKDHRAVTAELVQKYGNKFSLKGFGKTLHFITDPKLIENILFTNSLNYPRTDNPLIDRIEDPSLILPKQAVFERWKKVRSHHLNPSMTDSMVRKYIDIVFEGNSDLLPDWEKFANCDSFPLYHLLQKLTFRNLRKSLLGNVEIDEESVIDTVDEFDRLEVEYELSLTKLAWKLPTQTRKRSYAVIDKLKQISDEVIKHCLSDSSEATVFKEIAAAYDAEYQLDLPGDTRQNLLRHIVGLNLIVGFDSLSRALPMTFAYLSMMPEIADKIREEVHTKIGDGPITKENIDLLAFTRAAFLEGLRYSGGIFPVIARKAYEDETFEDYSIGKNETIIIPVHYMTRLEEYWPNPEGFNPNRFFSINLMDEKYRYVFLPFGAGIRGCLGKHFAIFQCTMIIAMVLKKYRLDLIPFQKINPDKPEEIKMSLRRL